ncbi:hypothetical protein Tco_1148807 [Tanacetum coccineum]
MASFDYRLNPLYAIKECSSCGALYTRNCGCLKGSLEDKILVPKPPQNYATCGDPVDGLYCRSCDFVRKCLNEGWYTIHDENEILNISESSNDNTNIVSAPQEPFVVNQDSSQSPLQINHNCCYECGDSLDGIFCQRCTCKSCGKGAHYGYNCPPQIPIISNLEPCYNQNLNDILQNLQSLQQQCLLGTCQQCGCNDGNDFLNSQNKLMEQMTSICDMVDQIMQNKKEEKRIAEEQASKDRYWKIPICYDDDEDYTIAITPSSVENLVPIPSEFEGISEDTCDVPVCKDPSTFDALNDHSEILSDSNDDDTSSDDDDFEDIEYVSLEEVNDVDQEEKEFDLEDILQIQDVILREKLLIISHLVTNIESLINNPTPDRVLKSSFSFPIPVTDSDSFFEETDTSLSHLDNSLPKFETFSDHTEETRSGSTTTHANNSLPEYESFLFEIELDQGGLISIVISDNSNDPLLEFPEFESFHSDFYDDPSFSRPPPEPPDVKIKLIITTDAPVINNFNELNEDECFDPRGDEIDVEDDDSFTFVIRTFLPFLTYPKVSPLPSSTKNEDTIFDPGIST